MSTKLIRTTMAAALIGLAGSAWGQGPLYESVQNGFWGTNATWQQRATEDDTWAAASEPPAAGDTVAIKHDVTVQSNASCAVLTIDSAKTLTIGGNNAGTLAVSGNATFTGSLAVAASGIIDLAGTITFNGSPVVTVANTGTFKVNGTSMSIGSNSFTVDSGGTLALVGAAPNVNVGSGLVLNGLLSMTSSSGTPYIVVPSTRSLPSAASGEVRGAVAAAAHPEVRIDSGVTVTNPGTYAGYLKIKGSSADVGTFANNGTVTANVEAELLLDSSLSAISDNNTAIWSVNYDSTSAILRFGQGASGLSGSFRLLQGCGILQISASISTPTLRVDQGRIVVDASQTFTYGTVSGSCSGSVPSSPMTAGSYPSASTCYCVP